MPDQPGRGVSDEEAARLAFGGLPMTPVRGHLCTDECPVGYHRHPDAEAGRVQAVEKALRWVIEHKSCSGFAACWAAAPEAIRTAIIEAWGGDPWPT